MPQMLPKREKELRKTSQKPSQTPKINRKANQGLSPKMGRTQKADGVALRSKNRQLKVPEALPVEVVKESAFDKIKSAVFRRKPAIQSIVREPTAGGIVFRFTDDKKDMEILLIQDSKGRWTIPKGHIEPGETAKMTARREIAEETGLKNVSILTWLGKIQFKYRRLDKLVLMTTQIYLVQALDQNETPVGEKWMKEIRWFKFADALNAVEYEDIEKLMLIAKKKMRAGEY